MAGRQENQHRYGWNRLVIRIPNVFNNFRAISLNKTVTYKVRQYISVRLGGEGREFGTQLVDRSTVVRKATPRNFI
jgi:hypothetical protein